MLDATEVRAELGVIRQRTMKPINVNFFCHTPAQPDSGREAAWKDHLAAYYTELGLDASASPPGVARDPFDETMCEVVEELKPEVVSFHFGLPESSLLSRVKASGCVVLSSATTVEEARWLEDHGCDTIIAQGYEAGGHRGMFLTDDVSTQVGTLALVPQVVDAVTVPVIAAGGIADGRGIQRPAGEEPDEPDNARGRADVRRGTSVPDRWRCASAPESRSRIGGSHRFLIVVVGTGGKARAGDQCRRSDPPTSRGCSPTAPLADFVRVNLCCPGSPADRSLPHFERVRLRLPA
jgi:nitronate monooxygenase